MTASGFIWRLTRSTVVAAVLTVPLSGDEFISVGTWLTITAIVMALGLVWDLLKSAQIEPARLSVIWTWRRGRRNKRETHPAVELRALKGTIASAQFNPRSYANRLRPRLDALANHFLPIQCGVDPRNDPIRTNALLGEVAWLLDPEVTDCSPTLDELNQFLTIVTGDQS